MAIRAAGHQVKKQRHAWIAVPSYTGTVHIPTMRSILSDALIMKDKGIAFTIEDEIGSALIGNSRGLMVARFLASTATDLIFIDWDVLWEAGTLVKLMRHPVDCVAAIYPQRADPENYSVSWITDRKELRADAKTGLLEAAGVPTGCVRMSRTMLEKMVSCYPNTEFYCEEAPNKKAWDLFGDYRIGKYKLGEDYAFCRRWRDINGKIWIDPEIKMGHIGLKAFAGHLGNFLRKDMK
jgi:hypothetical protein